MVEGFIDMITDIEDDVKRCEKLAYNMKQDMVNLASKFDSPTHWGSELSSVEIMAVLFGSVMNLCDEEYCRDKFLLSKGHAALCLYSAMYEVGLLSKTQYETFQEDGSFLSEISEMNRKIGIEASGGSLGITPSYAVGLALLAKKRNYTYDVYFEVGDGELDEGSVWESVMSASQYELDNLVMIVDANKLQLDGKTSDIMSWDNLEKRLHEFGWEVISVNGHSCEELISAFGKLKENHKPKAIIADTIKGHGVSFMENNYRWHDNHLRGEQLKMAKEELGKC